jgi:hypothetical protein
MKYFCCGDNEKEKQKSTSSAANQTVTGPSQKLSGMFNNDQSGYALSFTEIRQYL